MSKTILVTGSTDGIGLVTAKMLRSMGHTVLLHGRNAAKLAKVEQELLAESGEGAVESYVADLSSLADVEAFAKAVAEKHDTLDVLINNAGVYNVRETVTDDGLDVRFVVNTIAPYLLTKRLLPLMGSDGRVVNLSSAAQASVNASELTKPSGQADGMVYAKSKLALTMWTNALAESLGAEGPVVVSVNPRSMLGSKMVKEAYGVNGHDLRIGGDILCRLSLADEFANASGKYFDNDRGQIASPHPDALSAQNCQEIVRVMETMLEQYAQ